ncbi:MAG: TerB family tellurite resistance protein [Polyangiaceae bacterium]
MLTGLDRAQRLQLLRFVCASAWADLEIKEGERAFVERLVKRMDLDDADRREVEGWLHVAPPPSDVNPTQVPEEHRRLFFEAARAVLYADGHASDEEQAHLEELRVAFGL